MRKLGDKINSLLLAKGYKQVDLARHLGLTGPAVGHYIHGRRVPPVKQLKGIAAFLGVTVAELIEDTAYITEDETEKRLLDAIRSLPPEQREAAAAMLEAFATTAKKESA